MNQKPTRPLGQKKVSSASALPKQGLSQTQKLQYLIEKAVEKKMDEFQEVFYNTFMEALTNFFPDQAEQQSQFAAIQQALSAIQGLSNGSRGGNAFASMKTHQYQRPNQQVTGKYSQHRNQHQQQMRQETYAHANVDLSDEDIIGNPGVYIPEDESPYNNQQHNPRMNQQAAQGLQQAAQAMGGMNPLDLVNDTILDSDDIQALDETQMHGTYELQQEIGGGMQQQQQYNPPQQAQRMQPPMRQQQQYAPQRPGRHFNPSQTPVVDPSELHSTRRDYVDPNELADGYNAAAHAAQRRIEQQNQPRQQ